MIQLLPHQIGIVREETTRDNVLVVSPMASGKTLATLTASTALIYRESVKNILIIAPKRVARGVWAQEAAKYDMGLNIRFCERAVDVKLFLVEPANHRICVCSVTRITEIPHGCWDMVIIDESTLFGNKKAIRSKEARRICNGVKRRVLLTGTPIHGGYEKLWHQIFLLDGGKALGKSLTAFREKYMRVKYQSHGAYTVWEMREDMIPQLHADIKHLVYVVKDSIDLPPCLYKNVYVELPAKRRKEYEAFEDTSIVSFREENKGVSNPYGDAKTLVAFAASARGSKLRLLATGCVYADENKKAYSVTHTEKIEALQDLVGSFDGGLLVAYQFQSEYEELKKAFPTSRQIGTLQDENDWNAGRIPIALAQSQSIGHGLNLQFGGHVIVWYSPTYDAEVYSQFNARLPRPGQKADSVSIIHLIARNTIEERVLKVIQHKGKNAEQFTKI